MFTKLRILSALVILIMCGCVSSEVRQEREAEKARRLVLTLDQNFGTPDKTLMFLGKPTNTAEGDSIFILEYSWSGCACNAILSYDNKTRQLVDWNITPCQFHGWQRFGITD